MANASEAIYWPFAIMAGGIFLFAVLALFSGVEQDIKFDTTERLAQVQAQALMQSWLNEEGTGNPDMNNFEKMAYEFCGKPEEQQLDWSVWGPIGSAATGDDAMYRNPPTDDDDDPPAQDDEDLSGGFSNPQLIKSVDASLGVPEECDIDPSQSGTQIERQPEHSLTGSPVEITVGTDEVLQGRTDINPQKVSDGKSYSYQAIIPTRGAGVMTMVMQYTVRTGDQ